MNANNTKLLYLKTLEELKHCNKNNKKVLQNNLVLLKLKYKELTGDEI